MTESVLWSGVIWFVAATAYGGSEVLSKVLAVCPSGKRMEMFIHTASAGIVLVICFVYLTSWEAVLFGPPASLFIFAISRSAFIYHGWIARQISGVQDSLLDHHAGLKEEVERHRSQGG